MNRSTSRIATCECVCCHAIVPKTQAVAVERTKKSGSIGWGFGVSQGTDGSRGRRSFSSGRDLYRTTTEWWCIDCKRETDAASTAGGFAVATLLIFLGLAAEAFSVGFMPFVAALFVGTWVTFWAIAGTVCAVIAYLAWQRYERIVDELDGD